jgi:lipopolysaccharide assembly protein A
MTNSAQPHRTTGTLPPPADNGSTPAPASAKPSAPRRGRLSTRISGMRTALIAGALAFTLALIFIIQNAHAVNISFLGAHLRLSLAVAMLLAAVAGALVMAAAGTARVTQLRRMMRRNRAKPSSG